MRIDTVTGAGGRRAARLLAGHPGPAGVATRRCRRPPAPTWPWSAAASPGLWTALLAKERDPGRDVVLLEGERIGWAATGRNGGFCAASLTHGVANGRERFPDEYSTAGADSAWRTSTRSRRRSARYGIDCDFERTGELDVATEDHQVDGLRELRPRPAGGEFLDRRTRCAPRCDSPTYLAGVLGPRRHRARRPGRTGLGAGRGGRGGSACGSTRTRRCSVSTRSGDRAGAAHARTGPPCTPTGSRSGTNAFPPLLRAAAALHRAGLRLRPGDRAAVAPTSWPPSAGRDRQGVGDTANQFHYYRLTADNRILWGGYDAIYHFGGRIRRRATTSARRRSRALAEHFFDDVPAAGGAALHPRAGAARSTPARRFCAFFGTAFAGRVGLRARLHRPRRRRHPLRRRGDARPARRRARPSAPSSRWYGAGRCPSRPSRCASPASR